MVTVNSVVWLTCVLCVQAAGSLCRLKCHMSRRRAWGPLVCAPDRRRVSGLTYRPILQNRTIIVKFIFCCLFPPLTLYSLSLWLPYVLICALPNSIEKRETKWVSSNENSTGRASDSLKTLHVAIATVLRLSLLNVQNRCSTLLLKHPNYKTKASFSIMKTISQLPCKYKQLKMEINESTARTRRYFLFFAYFMVLSKFDPLMRFNAGFTEPLPTFHTESNGAGIIFTAGTNLLQSK